MEAQSPREVLWKAFVLGEECTAHCPRLAPHTFTVALDGIWNIRRNLPVGGTIPGQQSRNSSLPQAKYYSRHGGLRSKSPAPQTPTGDPRGSHSLQTSGVPLSTSVRGQPFLPCSVQSHFTYPLPVIQGSPPQTSEKFIPRLTHLSLLCMHKCFLHTARL